MAAPAGETDFLTELKKALARLHRTGSSKRDSDGFGQCQNGPAGIDDVITAPRMDQDFASVEKASTGPDEILMTSAENHEPCAKYPTADGSRRLVTESLGGNSRGNYAQLFRDIVAAKFDKETTGDLRSSDNRTAGGTSESLSCGETVIDGPVCSSPARSEACISDNAISSLDAATATSPTGGVFYGELSNVLQKRSEQRPSSSMRVIELESKPRIGNSVMYIGRGGTKRDSAAHSVAEDVMSSSTTLMTVTTVVGGCHSSRNSFQHQYAASEKEEGSVSSLSESPSGVSVIRRRESSPRARIDERGQGPDAAAKSYEEQPQVSTSSEDFVDSQFRKTLFIAKQQTRSQQLSSCLKNPDEPKSTAIKNQFNLNGSHPMDDCRALGSSQVLAQSGARRTQSAPDSTASSSVRAAVTDQWLSRSVPRLPEIDSEVLNNNDRTNLVDGVSKLVDSCGLGLDIWRLTPDERSVVEKRHTLESATGPAPFADNETMTETLDSRISRNETNDPVSIIAASMSSSTWTSDDHLSDSTTSTSGTDHRRDMTPPSRAMADVGERCSTSTPSSSHPNRDSACPLSDTSTYSAAVGELPPIQRDWSAMSFRRVQSENDVISGVSCHNGAAIANAVAQLRRNRNSCSSLEITSTGEAVSSTGGFEGTEQCTSIEVNLYSSKAVPDGVDRRSTSCFDDDDEGDEGASDIDDVGCEVMRQLIKSSLESNGDRGGSSLQPYALERPRVTRNHEQTHPLGGGATAGLRSGPVGLDYAGSGFATFPMQRQPQVRYCSSGMTSVGNHDDRDVIANLMITHSGEPMCVGLFDSCDVSRVRTMTSHNDLPPLSVPVTVPEPTSFHQVGSLACQQLIGVSDHRLQGQRETAASGGPMPSRYRSSSDSQSTRSSSDNRSRVVRHHRVDRRRPTVANATRSHRCVDSSSSSETGGSNGDTANPCRRISDSEGVSGSRGPTDSLLEADISGDGSSFDEPTTKFGRAGGRCISALDSTDFVCDGRSSSDRRRMHQQERKLGRNWRLSQSPLMLHQQATYCVNSEKQLVRLDLVSRQRRRHNRELHRRPMSADDVLMDLGNIAVTELSANDDDQHQQLQSEDESLRQNSAVSCEDEFERSLIQYVKNDEMTDGMRTLYRHQLDSNVTARVTWNRNGRLEHPNNAVSLLDQLACCFVCNNDVSTTNSSRSPAKKYTNCYSTNYKNKNIRRLPTIADYTSVPVTAYGLGLVKGIVEQTSDFYVDTKGLRGSLKVQVDGPSHSVKCYAESVTDCRYRIYYLPSEVGIFTVTITWNDHHLEGSPFHAKVIDPGQVTVVGGWSKLLDKRDQLVLKVGVEKQLEFDVRQAGPGKLMVVVEAPNGELPVDIVKSDTGKYAVSFTPQIEGVYHMSINWSDVPIARSPLPVIAVHSMAALEIGDTTLSRLSDVDGAPAAGRSDVVCPDRVLVVATTSRGQDKSDCQLGSSHVLLTQHLALNETRAQQNIEFTIDGSKGAGPGVPSVKLIGLKEELDVLCNLLTNGRYACSCSPQHPGAYLLEVTWSGRHVSGSPFKLTVLPSGDASQVVCYIDGQHHPSVGSELKVHICTDNTGPGELSVCCAGPQTMAPCKLIDHQNGHFSLHIRPLEGGTHHLCVQFNGTHVPGSPFDIQVQGQVDASKVTVSGPGIKDGLLSNYCSYFIVDTTGAGVGQLTVRIRGPKGAFRVEMMRHHPKDRTILCRFDPTEAGQYTIHVKWSGINVPGSPFTVNISHVTQELDKLQP